MSKHHLHVSDAPMKRASPKLAQRRARLKKAARERAKDIARVTMIVGMFQRLQEGGHL